MISIARSLQVGPSFYYFAFLFLFLFLFSLSEMKNRRKKKMKKKKRFGIFHSSSNKTGLFPRVGSSTMREGHYFVPMLYRAFIVDI